MLPPKQVLLCSSAVERSRDGRQLLHSDQLKPPTLTPEYPVLGNWRTDSNAGSTGMVRGVKPFVKEWVERQNQAITDHYADQVRYWRDGNKCTSSATNEPPLKLGFFNFAKKIVKNKPWACLSAAIYREFDVWWLSGTQSSQRSLFLVVTPKHCFVY